MSRSPYQVLFICTGNSARSILAEALKNDLGRGRFAAHSAGSHPRGEVHPLALQTLARHGVAAQGARSNSWDEFEAPDAPQMDFILTVCGNAEGEVCPVWPGQPISAHWGFEDPAAVIGDDQAKRAAFNKIFRQILARVQLLVNLPPAMLERSVIKRELQAIGASST